MNKIVKVISQMINLLKECEWNEQAEWMENKLKMIKGDKNEKRINLSALSEIKKVLGGMGSFSDIPMVPSKKSGLTKIEAEALQIKLINEFDLEYRKIIS